MNSTKPIQQSNNRAWITWEVQPRNKSMATLLNADYLEMNSTRGRVGRYFELSKRTLSVFRNRQYQTIFVQNPSIVLALLSVISGKLFGKKVVVDAHNAGVFPKEGTSLLLKYVIVFISRVATCTIVSNKYLAKVIESYGGKTFVMPDPLPDCSHNGSDTPKYDLAFICTWSEDEPYFEVIQAAHGTPELSLAITGNFRKVLPENPDLPDNISLLGYVSEADYLSLIHNASLLIDLTTREDCLVCGAYEAIAVGTPSIISDTRVNREVFSKGFIYSSCDADGIKDAIVKGMHSLEQLNQDIAEAHDDFLISSQRNAKALNETLGS